MAEETVRIQSDDFEGGVVINKADFDEKKHKIFVEKEAKKTKNLGEGEPEIEWTHAKLMGLTKDDLIARAKEDKGLEYPSPDEVTKEDIAKAYLDAK